VGALWEPLTLLSAPVGMFLIASPTSDSILYGPPDGEEELLVTRLSYREEPSVSIVTAYCDDRTAHWSSPDHEGVFRYESLEPRDLTSEQYQVFCETDWSEPRRLMRQVMSESQSKTIASKRRVH